MINIPYCSHCSSLHPKVRIAATRLMDFNGYRYHTGQHGSQCYACFVTFTLLRQMGNKRIQRMVAFIVHSPTSPNAHIFRIELEHELSRAHTVIAEAYSPDPSTPQSETTADQRYARR